VVDGLVTPLTGSGSIEVSAAAQVSLRTGGAIPKAFALDQNYPNPFNPTTTIHYQLPTDQQEVSLRIYDIAGQVVRELVKGPQATGTYSVVWDGRNARGATAGNGVYFYQLRSGTFNTVHKMLLLK
jgi:flagellar hook assembly protein FlgD